MELEIKVKMPAVSVYRTIVLPRCLYIVNVDTFKIFDDWVYYTENGLEVSYMKIDARSAMNLWILVGRLEVPTCQNALIVAPGTLRKGSGMVHSGIFFWSLWTEEPDRW